MTIVGPHYQLAGWGGSCKPGDANKLKLVESICRCCRFWLHIVLQGASAFGLRVLKSGARYVVIEGISLSLSVSLFVTWWRRSVRGKAAGVIVSVLACLRIGAWEVGTGSGQVRWVLGLGRLAGLDFRVI